MSHKTSATVVPTIGIDTGKNTLHLIGLDDNGTIVLREKIARGRIAARLANVPRCLIGIEAGMATHYVARELIALKGRYRPLMPNRSGKVTRTTSGTPTRSRRLFSGRPPAAFQ
jgi:transposase